VAIADVAALSRIAGRFGDAAGGTKN
jgi:hypothetical protein